MNQNNGKFYLELPSSSSIYEERHIPINDFPIQIFCEKFSKVSIFEELIFEKSIPQRIDLGKIFIKIFDGKLFTGICFSLEILLKNNSKYNFPLFRYTILV